MIGYESASRALARARQHACVADIDLIQNILCGRHPHRTVILGAGSGTMSLAWHEARDSSHMVLATVDNDAQALAWEATAWENAGFGDDPNIQAAVTQIFGDSNKAAERPWGSKIDFLIVDADHSFEGVARDLEAWLPIVAPNGTVLLHDYDARSAPQHYPGVKAAADEWLMRPEWHPFGRSGWSATWFHASGGCP